MGDFFQDSNNVLLVLSDMEFKSIEEFTKDGRYAHAMKNEIDNSLYSDMTMEQVCTSLREPKFGNCKCF